MKKTIIEKYYKTLKENNIKPDQAQEQILEFLANLNQSINDSLSRKNILKKLLEKKELVRGLYLHGSVGVGKSIIMDIFFENIATNKKQKTHFHSFMLEVHKYLHQSQENKQKSSNPLKTIAKFLKEKFQVLYIDELYINDITDAMLVGKLFKELIDQDIIIVITSNFAPNELYTDGLQRESFIPFIKLIENQLDILQMNSNYDYRAHKLKSVTSTYYVYQEIIDSQKFILDSFAKLSNNAPVKNYLLDIDGRELICPLTTLDCTIFSFDQLCRAPLANSDYIAICENFNIIFISEIPELRADEHNELRRFIYLIDTIYEYKRLLICSSNTDIDSIYKSGKWHFEFLRTASRLKEMQSEDYLKHFHR